MNQQCIDRLDAQAFKNRINSIKDSYSDKKFPRTFGDTLSYHIEQHGHTNESMEGLTGISDRTFKRYRNNKTRISLQNLTLICLALHLEPDFSEDLVQKAGYYWRTDNVQDIACHLLIREKFRDNLDSMIDLFEIAGIEYKVAN